MCGSKGSTPTEKASNKLYSPQPWFLILIVESVEARMVSRSLKVLEELGIVFPISIPGNDCDMMLQSHCNRQRVLDQHEWLS